MSNFAVLDDLLRLVVHAFYGPEQVITSEILLREQRPMSEEEIARRLKLNARQVRRGLAALKVDKLLESFIKKEEARPNEFGEVQTKKWQQQEFWYIDFKRMVDVIKYRIFVMSNKILHEADKGLENQQYFCPKCKARYSALDASRLLNIENQILQCERCFSELQEEDSSIRVTEVQNKQATLMTQLKKITEQLKKTEGMVIPRVNLKELIKRDFSDDGALEGGSSINNGSRGPVWHHQQQPTVKVDFSMESAASRPEETDNKRQKTSNPQFPVLSVTADTGTKGAVPWLIKATKEEATSSATQADVTAPVDQETVLEDAVTDNYYNEFMETQGNDNEVDHTEPTGQAETSSAESKEEESSEEEEEEETVKVGDRLIPLSDVTEEDKQKMTTEEYQDYFAKLSAASGFDM